jgi:hypothetical protein
MNSATRKVVAAVAAPTVAAVVASCSIVIGGSATRQTTTPASVTAAGPGNTPAIPPPTVSAEDQVRQTVTAFQDAYNTQNWEAYTDLMCSAMRSQFTGPTMDSVKKGRAQNGLTTVKITSVSVTGDSADATMDVQNEALGSGTLTLPLKREDGWKVCKTW